MTTTPGYAGPAAAAAIVTKNYPDDTLCELDRTGRWRLNIHVGRAAFGELTGEDPRAETSAADFTVVDAVLSHPVYRAQGWVSIINPGSSTRSLAVQAHDNARRRATRRKLPTATES